MPPAPVTAALAGRPEDEEVKPYVIVGNLGHGSFAIVYKGYHEETRREVAIKTVSRSNLTSKLFENLQSEIDILKSLSHRHITRLIDIVRAERNIYLIMEYCAGGDLTNYIKKRGRVDGLEYIPEPGAPPQYYQHPRTGGLAEIVVRSFLRQLARALKFLRQRNLIHRDIKPQNLLLTPAPPGELARGHPVGVPILKVADFGFARSLPNQMLAETLCGSPLYMAPEILSYQRYDAKADLWSVGAVLYETAVGRPPFRAMNHIELLKKIEASRSIRFPDEDTAHAGADAPPRVPDDIKALIRTLLRRVPAERSSFDEFFKSPALANSKFPRPAPAEPQSVNGHAPSTPPRSAVPLPPAESPIRIGEIPESHTKIPPEVLDPSALVPPSKFHFRRRENAIAGPSSPPMTPPPTAGTAAAPAKASEGSVIPGETEEDGMLRREYVLVGDTRALEFNKAVDEINAARRRTGPLIDRHGIPTPLPLEHSPSDPDFFAQDPAAQPMRRRISNGASPPLPQHVPAPNGIAPSTPVRSTSSPPSHITPLPLPSSRPPSTSRDPPPPRSYSRDTSSSPRTHDASPAHFLITRDVSALPAATFPPPPNAGAPPQTPQTLSRSPSNALSRALTLASKKLFGAPPLSVSPKRTSIGSIASAGARRMSNESSGGGAPGLSGMGMAVDGGAVVGSPRGAVVRDPVEDELLAALEQLAQKTDVITRWADEMYDYVKAVPQKPLPNPKTFTPREGETERLASKRHRADVQAEYNAVTCVAVYMLVMSFSQKGIDELRRYQEHMEMRHPDGDFEVSDGFDDALAWFREHFLKCNDRVALVKTWLPDTYTGPRTWVDELVYNRALTLSRTAARKELFDQQATPDECERLYEDSLWCLYALQDDLLQKGNPFMDEDRETIATWIKRTKLRLYRCRARMSMDKRDRLRDVRADRNLDDVNRTPAPWDAAAMEELRRTGPNGHGA